MNIMTTTKTTTTTTRRRRRRQQQQCCNKKMHSSGSSSSSTVLLLLLLSYYYCCCCFCCCYQYPPAAATVLAQQQASTGRQERRRRRRQRSITSSTTATTTTTTTSTIAAASPIRASTSTTSTARQQQQQQQQPRPRRQQQHSASSSRLRGARGATITATTTNHRNNSRHLQGNNNKNNNNKNNNRDDDDDKDNNDDDEKEDTPAPTAVPSAFPSTNTPTVTTTTTTTTIATTPPPTITTTTQQPSTSMPSVESNQPSSSNSSTTTTSTTTSPSSIAPTSTVDDTPAVEKEVDDNHQDDNNSTSTNSSTIITTQSIDLLSFWLTLTHLSSSSSSSFNTKEDDVPYWDWLLTRALQDYLRYNMFLLNGSSNNDNNNNDGYFTKILSLEAVDLQLIESDVSIDNGAWHYFHLQGHVDVVMMTMTTTNHRGDDDRSSSSSNSSTTAAAAAVAATTTVVQQEQDSVLQDLQHLQAFLRQELDDTQLRVQEVYLFERRQQANDGQDYPYDSNDKNESGGMSSNKNSGLEMVLIGSLVGFAVLLAVAIVIYTRWRYVQRRQDDNKNKKKNNSNRQRPYRPLEPDDDDDDDLASAFSRASSSPAGLLLDRYYRQQSSANVSVMADSICTLSSTSSLAGGGGGSKEGTTTTCTLIVDELPPTNTSDDTLLYLEDDDSEEEEEEEEAEIKGGKSSSTRPAKSHSKTDDDSSSAFLDSDDSNDDDEDKGTSDTNNNNNGSSSPLQFDPNHPEPRPLDDCNRSREETLLLQQSSLCDQPETTVKCCSSSSSLEGSTTARNEVLEKSDKDNNDAAAAAAAAAYNKQHVEDEANKYDFEASFDVQEVGAENHPLEMKSEGKEDSPATLYVETTITRGATLSDPASANEPPDDDNNLAKELSQVTDESVGEMNENTKDRTREEATSATNDALHNEKSNNDSVDTSKQVDAVCVEQEVGRSEEESGDAESERIEEEVKQKTPVHEEDSAEELGEDPTALAEDAARFRQEQDSSLERSMDDGAAGVVSARQNLAVDQETTAEFISPVDEGDESVSDDLNGKDLGEESAKQDAADDNSSTEGNAPLGFPEQEQDSTNDNALQQPAKAVKAEEESSRTKLNEPLEQLSFNQESFDDIEQDCIALLKSPEPSHVLNEDTVQEQEDSEGEKFVSLQNTSRHEPVENAISNVKQSQKETKDSSDEECLTECVIDEPVAATIIIEEDFPKSSADRATDDAEALVEATQPKQENDQDRSNKAEKQCMMEGSTEEIGETALLAEGSAGGEQKERDSVPEPSVDELVKARLISQAIQGQSFVASIPECMNNERALIASSIETNIGGESMETSHGVPADSVDGRVVETADRTQPTTSVVEQIESNVLESITQDSDDLAVGPPEGDAPIEKSWKVLMAAEEDYGLNCSKHDDLAIENLERLDPVTGHSVDSVQGALLKKLSSSRCDSENTNLGEPIDTTTAVHSSLLDEAMTPKLNGNVDDLDADLADTQRSCNVMLEAERVENTPAIEENDRYGIRSSSQNSSTDKFVQSAASTIDDSEEAEGPDQVSKVEESESTATLSEEDPRNFLLSPDTSSLVQQAEHVLGKHDCGRPFIHSQQIMATPELLRRSEHVLTRHENSLGADTLLRVAENTLIDSPVRVVSFENGSPSKHLEESGDRGRQISSLPGHHAERDF